jgi:pyruvate dehydrogenase phosphatase
VFDGHGGWEVAELASQRLIPGIMQELGADLTSLIVGKTTSGNVYNPISDNPKIVKAFHDFDNYYINTVAKTAFAAGSFKVASVGSCVCVGMVSRPHGLSGLGHLVVANLGDCRAVLASGDNTWIAKQITNDHNCRLKVEQEALQKAHPEETIGIRGDLIIIQSPTSCYLKGCMQLTRALGDLDFKYREFNPPRGSPRHLSNPYNPPYVLNTPDIFSRELEVKDKYVFVFLHTNNNCMIIIIIYI